MIPILFEKTDTSFVTNGIGRLIDAVSCKVTEQRNGSYELVLQYPTCGRLYGQLQEGCIILAKANDTNDPQGFRIYKSTKPVNGISTVYARHISYDLNGVPIMALDIEESAPVQIWRAATPLLDHPFTFESDINLHKRFISTLPRSLRNLIGGDKNSLLTVFGGELEFDNYKVKLHSERGNNAAISIRYGKNIISAEQERNINDMYTHLLPYAIFKNTEDDTETVIMLSSNDGLIQLIDPATVGHQKAHIADLSKMFANDEEINATNLQVHAEEYIEQYELTVPLVNIKIILDDVSKNADSFRIAPRETLGLCDWVYVYFEKLNVTALAQVIKTEYDSLTERMTAIEVGKTKSTLTNTVSTIKESIKENQHGLSEEEKRANAALQAAISAATDKITGNSGGYVVLYPANNPQEILIMDSDDKEAAARVWRWNKSGLGYSKNGYDGPYGLAMTMDGEIVADYITTGTLNAITVKGCSIEGGVININDKFIVDKYGNSTLKSSAIEDFGGRNFILNSNVERKNSDYKVAEYTPSEPLTDGETYTISMCVTPAAGIKRFAPHVSKGMGWLCDLTPNGTGKQLLKATFTAKYYSGRTPDVDTSHANIDIFRLPNDGTITGETTIHWIKVEKGRTSTDWTPAPEDVIESIAEIKTQADIDRAAVDIIAKWKQGATESIAKIQEQADKDRAAVDIIAEWKNGLTIGGRNYILNSDVEHKNNKYLIATYTPSEPLVKGEKYTISLCVTPAAGVTHFAPHVSSGNKWLCDVKVNGTKKQIVTTTFTAAYASGKTPDDNRKYATIELYRLPNNETITGETTIHWIKVESGSIATDWTPAPEEVTESIAGIKAQAENGAAFAKMFAGCGNSAGEICINAINGESAAKISADRIDLEGQELNVKVDAANIFGTFSVEAENGARISFGKLVNGLGVESKDFKASSAGTAVRIFPHFITYEESGSGTVAIEFDMSGHTLKGIWNINRSGTPTAITSDATKKNSITLQPEVYSRIFDRLRAVIFKYNNGTSDRFHTGLIAQDLEEAILAEGITTQEFAAVCYDIDENGNKTNYGIRYEELVSMCIYEIQKLKARIAELQATT